MLNGAKDIDFGFLCHVRLEIANGFNFIEHEWLKQREFAATEKPVAHGTNETEKEYQ